MFEFGSCLIVARSPCEVRTVSAQSDIEDQNVSLSVFVDMLLIVKLFVAFYLGNSKEIQNSCNKVFILQFCIKALPSPSSPTSPPSFQLCITDENSAVQTRILNEAIFCLSDVPKG